MIEIMDHHWINPNAVGQMVEENSKIDGPSLVVTMIYGTVYVVKGKDISYVFDEVIQATQRNTEPVEAPAKTEPTEPAKAPSKSVNKPMGKTKAA